MRLLSQGKFKAEGDGFPQNAQIAPKTVPDPNAVRLSLNYLVNNRFRIFCARFGH